MQQHQNQRLTMSMEEEVLWLHSLWKIGPPPNPNNNNNNSINNNPLSINFPPLFNREKKKKRRRRSIEWPCDLPSDPTSDAGGGWASWANVPPPPPTSRKTLTCEEIARFMALQVQQKGISASKEFFATKDSSDDEEDEEEVVSGFLGFFLDMFEQDGDLRDYYKKSYEKGEFCCLVCAGLGRKVRKTFGDCVSLVLHANSISKTKGREAHRAYAKVMCQVIGWDAERLPTIVCGVSGELKHSSIEASSLKQPDRSFDLPCNLPPPDNLLPDTGNDSNSQGNAAPSKAAIQNALNNEEQMKITALQEDVHVDANINQDEEEVKLTGEVS